MKFINGNFLGVKMVKNILKYTALLSGLVIASAASAAEYDLVFQSSDYVGEKNFEVQKEWLQSLEKASNGRLDIELLPNGGVVAHKETLDAMRLGLLDGHMTATGYFSDKNQGIALMGNTVGAWSDVNDYLKYLYQGGGNELMVSLYKPYGVHFVGGYTSGLEAFVSKIPLKGVDDLKKITMRSPDSLVSRVFAAAGAKPINLPGGQIKQALENGTINAADYSVFSTNQSAGMNDLAPYPVYPGFHSMPALDFSMAQSTWDKLPRELQNLFSSSIEEFAYSSTATLKKADDIAIAEAKKNPEITIQDWPVEERKKFRAIAQEQWRLISEESPEAKQAYESLTKFLTDNGLL